jgi:hypothetical protein
MQLNRFQNGWQVTIGLLISTLLLASSSASAETIEFSCQRSYINNPATVYYQVDLSASKVSDVSGKIEYRSTHPASITQTSIDWQDGKGSDAQKYHLDRLSGHMTLLVPAPSGIVTMEFECHKTSGF